MPTNERNHGSTMLALMRQHYDLEQTRASNDRPSLTLDAEILRVEHRMQQLMDLDEIPDRNTDARGTRGSRRQHAQRFTTGDDRNNTRDNAQGNTEASDSGQDVVNDPCPICLEQKEHPLETPCHHAFCSDCINRWLDEEWNDTCPSCRADLDSRDLRPANRRQQSSSSRFAARLAQNQPTTPPVSQPPTRDRQRDHGQSERHRHPTASSISTDPGDRSSSHDGNHRSSSSTHDHRRERSPASHRARTSRRDHQQNRSGGHWLPLLPPRSQNRRRPTSSRHRQRSPSPQGSPEYGVVYEENIEFSNQPFPLPRAQPRHDDRINETSREAKMRGKVEQMRVLLNCSKEVAVCIDALKRKQGNVFAAVDYPRDCGSPRTTGAPRSVELGKAITRELRRYPVLWEHLVDL